MDVERCFVLGLTLPSLAGGAKKFPSQLAAPTELLTAKDTELPDPTEPTNEFWRFLRL